MSRYTEYVKTRVTKAQLRQLKKISRKKNKPMAEILRELLENYIYLYNERGE